MASLIAELLAYKPRIEGSELGVNSWAGITFVSLRLLAVSLARLLSLCPSLDFLPTGRLFSLPQNKVTTMTAVEQVGKRSRGGGTRRVHDCRWLCTATALRCCMIGGVCALLDGCAMRGVDGLQLAAGVHGEVFLKRRTVACVCPTARARPAKCRSRSCGTFGAAASSTSWRPLWQRRAWTSAPAPWSSTSAPRSSPKATCR